MALVSSDPLRECVEDMVQKAVRWRARRPAAEMSGVLLGPGLKVVKVVKKGISGLR